MILQRGFAEHGITLSKADMAAATEEFVLWYDQNIDHGTRIFDNLMPILDRARAQNIKMGVVTNKREGLAAKLLFRLNLQAYFDVLVGNGAAVTGTDSFDLVALDEPEDRALIGASFAAGNRYFALEVGLRGEFGGDTEVVSGGASLRVNF